MEPVPFHIGITTNDLRTSMGEIGAALGVTWSPPEAATGWAYTAAGEAQSPPVTSISREGPIHIDLMEGGAESVWGTTRPRIHHFAYWTDDVAGDIDRLVNDGWTLEMTVFDADGQPSGFAYLVSEEGVRLELLDESGRDSYVSRIQSSSESAET
jgi:hypothetical protein